MIWVGCSAPKIPSLKCILLSFSELESFLLLGKKCSPHFWIIYPETLKFHKIYSPWFIDYKTFWKLYVKYFWTIQIAAIRVHCVPKFSLSETVFNWSNRALKSKTHSFLFLKFSKHSFLLVHQSAYTAVTNIPIYWHTKLNIHFLFPSALRPFRACLSILGPELKQNLRHPDFFCRGQRGLLIRKLLLSPRKHHIPNHLRDKSCLSDKSW